MTIDLRQLSDFALGDQAAWTDLAKKALQSTSLDRLTKRTSDNLAIPPLSAPAVDRAPLLLRPEAEPWIIAQSVVLGDAATTNRIILEHLEHGVGAIDLILPSQISGVINTKQAMASLKDVLQGVHLNFANITLLPSAENTLNSSEILSEYFSHIYSSQDFPVSLSVDPVYMENLNGSIGAGKWGNLHEDAYNSFMQNTPLGRTNYFSARGDYWHALGASEVHQLALVISTGIAIIERLSDADSTGRLATAALDRLTFRLVADHNQFATIAKFRALRRLWALVLRSWQLPDARSNVTACPAWRTMTRRDPWVNILRSTVATAAAAIGGADTILTVPHTALLGQADADARRLSRNIQSILMEESNLHVVGDAAAGSGGLEELTDSFAEAAWAEVQQIDREGGIIRSWREGGLANRIRQADTNERRQVATRRLPITGTSTWPLIDEQAPNVTGAPEFMSPAPDATRLAEPWEDLRDRADAMLAERGRRPTVFLAALGPVSEFITRTNWAKNVMEAGGIQAQVPVDRLDGSADVARAWSQSTSDIVCLCSSDAVYAQCAAEAAAALKQAGAPHVMLAGKPGENEAAWRTAGVDRFIHEGLDMLELLGNLHNLIAGLSKE